MHSHIVAGNYGRYLRTGTSSWTPQNRPCQSLQFYIRDSWEFCWRTLHQKEWKSDSLENFPHRKLQNEREEQSHQSMFFQIGPELWLPSKKKGCRWEYKNRKKTHGKKWVKWMNSKQLVSKSEKCRWLWLEDRNRFNYCFSDKNLIPRYYQAQITHPILLGAQENTHQLQSI